LEPFAFPEGCIDAAGFEYRGTRYARDQIRTVDLRLQGPRRPGGCVALLLAPVVVSIGGAAFMAMADGEVGVMVLCALLVSGLFLFGRWLTRWLARRPLPDHAVVVRLESRQRVVIRFGDPEAAQQVAALLSEAS
jgi:uncharacterized protein (DUF58 family)